MDIRRVRRGTDTPIRPYPMTIIAIIDRVVLRRTDEDHRDHVIRMHPT
jgi:hypothetical protein